MWVPTAPAHMAFFSLTKKLSPKIKHLNSSILNTVEQAKFASAIISRIRELVSPSQTYPTQSIACLITLSTTGGDGASVGEFHP